MSSISNSPIQIQTNIGFSQIPDAIFFRHFFIYLTPREILKFGSTCSRVQSLAIDGNTIFALGIHQFGLTSNDNIVTIVTNLQIAYSKLNIIPKNQKESLFLILTEKTKTMKI